MKVDKRVAKNGKSVLALKTYLQQIVQKPGSYADEANIAEFLKSQGSLSKYNNRDRAIYCSSLNTIKRIANSVIDGGFETLDRLRISALDAVKTHKIRTESPNKVTKAGLKIQNKEKDHESQQALQDIWHLSMVIRKLSQQANSYAQESGNPVIIKRCEREQRELRSMLSLRKHPVASIIVESEDD
jgi:hypothetical protein